MMIRAFIIAIFALLLPLAAYAETPGKDGDATVSANVIINQYAALDGNANAGASSITVRNLASAMPGLEAGDLIMLYQAQGARIRGSDNSDYGRVTNLGNAGRYEFQTVGTVNGNVITFENYGNRCTGLRYSYDRDGQPQVIRVPQYRNLTITGSGRITARPWDGETGGVVAVQVAGTFAHNGVIDVSGAGFRGGAVDNFSTPTGTNNVTYRSAAAQDGGEKGEGIAGYRDDLPNDLFYGRGAAANGGGGGNGHNAGGGGGANGNNGLTWQGQGVPNLSGPNWAQAWNIDPSLNATTRNSGGGRGGYTYARSGNPLTIPPGDSRWGFDLRREVGGLGGRPMVFEADGRLYLGGGGGAGDGNNNAAGAGGRGGGLAFVITETLTGSGTIQADGNDGQNTSPSHNDGPGGGGGGGTIVVKSRTGTAGLRLQADGGDGGNQLITNDENEGPGGGGGGGVIATSSGASVRFARGGANGTTSASSMTAFPPNGATQGADGQPVESAPSDAALPFCRAPDLPLQVEKTSISAASSGPERFSLPGNDKIYTITITNPGAQIDNDSIIVTDNLPIETIFFSGDFNGPAPGTSAIEFVDGTGSAASGLTCCSAAQISYSAQAAGTDFSYIPVTDYDPVIRRIRIIPSGSMNAGFVDLTQFTLRLRVQIE